MASSNATSDLADCFNIMTSVIVLISCCLLAGLSECLNFDEYPVQPPHKRQSRAAYDDKEFSNEILTWTCPFQDSLGNFYESEMWYKFLNSLYCKLSEYEIQVAKRRYNVADIEEWGNPSSDIFIVNQDQDSQKEGIEINQHNFERFLEKIEEYDIAEHYGIANINISESQLKELNHVLDLTLKKTTHVSCKEPYLFIKGDYIITSHDQFLKSEIDENCEGLLFSDKLKFLNIFALNTLFIDADISSTEGLEAITMIAPKWQIIDARNIKFRGKDGLQSIRGVTRLNGTDGKPGKPGGPGGNFFGIGEEFINGKDLFIFVKGGNGGNGEEGTDGRYGKDGDTPTVPSGYGCNGGLCSGEKRINFFKCELIDCQSPVPKGGSPIYAFESRETCRYKILGDNGTEGGSGGDGGKGGKGGYPGNIELFELNNYSEISKFNESVYDGIYGRGGLGGYGGKIGNDIIVFCTQYLGYSAWGLKSTICTNERFALCRSVSDGANFKQMETPETATGISNLDKAKIINQYKSYLRENLNDRFKNYFLSKFLNLLENNNKIKSVYDTLGFIDELQSLEEHFHYLNEYVNPLHFYRSLLNRIREYSENLLEPVIPSLHKKVLGYLYVATLGRIYNLEEDLESNLIIDITTYLKSVKNDIEKLKNFKNEKNTEEVLNKYKQEYKNEIDGKIKEAIDIISQDIMPEIDNIVAEFDGKIESLIKEVIHLKQQARIEHDQLIKKQQQLEHALVLQNVISSLKTFGQVLNFLGPAGVVAGSIIGIGGTVAETFIFNTPGNLNSTPPLTESVAELETLKGKMKYLRDQKVDSLKKILKRISHEANKHPDTLSDVSDKVSHFENRLDKISRGKVHLEDIQNLEIELKTTIDTKEREFINAQDSSEEQKAKNEFLAIQKMQKTIQLSSVVLDFYNKHYHNQAKVDVIKNAVNQNEYKFQKVKQFEDKLYSTITPMVQNIQNNIDSAISNLGTKSKVAFDVAKWKVKSTLQDAMIQMQQLTREFKVQGQLARCIEKIKESIITLINVHDHVQDYQNDQYFADLIANINSITVSDTHLVFHPKLENEFRHALRNLEITVKSSIIVQRYKVAIDAFKQFVFPFADAYFKELMLPTHIKLQDNKNNITLEDLVFKAVSEIDHINSKVEEYKETLRKRDGCIGTGEFKSDYVSSKPFFVWDNELHKNIISKLLSGKTVTVKSDIRDSAFDKDAIKFNAINFDFKSKDETKQIVINDALKGFQISAIHLGDSHYRYNNRTYLMTTPIQAIWFSFEKNPSGEPVHKSISYDKIKNGDFMLSPYASWKIQLHKITNYISFKDLEMYKDEIDLELEGSGHYISVNKRNIYCSALNVEEYYKSINANDPGDSEF